MHSNLCLSIISYLQNLHDVILSEIQLFPVHNILYKTKSIRLSKDNNSNKKLNIIVTRTKYSNKN
jgi:hypothetical protein